MTLTRCRLAQADHVRWASFFARIADKLIARFATEREQQLWSATKVF